MLSKEPMKSFLVSNFKCLRHVLAHQAELGPIQCKCGRLSVPRDKHLRSTKLMSIHSMSLVGRKKCALSRVADDHMSLADF